MLFMSETLYNNKKAGKKNTWRATMIPVTPLPDIPRVFRLQEISRIMAR